VISPADEQQHVAPLMAALADLGRLPFVRHSLTSVLQQVTTLAGRLLSGDPVATSLTVLTSARAATAAATDRLALDLDEVQYRLGAGPCLEAATSGSTVEIVDLRAEQRWPEFAELAGGRGLRGVLSVPFPRTPSSVSGGLNMYVRRSDTWDPETRRLAHRFAAAAVVPVANRHLYQSALERSEQLEAALASRAVIDQAKGILMERFKLSADMAFQALARVSMETNTKVRDLAAQVVETGEFPGS
jgi:GAF domain-containing protein